MAAVDVMPDEDQLLSLKMMRLRQPTLGIKTKPYYEPKDFSQDYDLFSDSYNFDLSSQLKAPDSLDVIYLGETFQSYLSVNSEVESGIIRGMTLKVELQATFRHVALIDTTITPKDIAARDSAKFMVKHEVKELGMHFLLCSVHYLTPTNDRKFFKKIYKVNVLNPLAVKTKANNPRMESNDGTVLLEVQVQNMSVSSIFLEKLIFEPTPLFSYQDLNTVCETIPFYVKKALGNTTNIEKSSSHKILPIYSQESTLSSKVTNSEAGTEELLKLPTWDAINKNIIDAEDEQILTGTLDEYTSQKDLEKIECQLGTANEDVYLTENEDLVKTASSNDQAFSNEKLEHESNPEINSSEKDSATTAHSNNLEVNATEPESYSTDPSCEQNTLNSSLTLESVANKLEKSSADTLKPKKKEPTSTDPSPNSKLEQASLLSSNQIESESIFGKHNYLKANDTRQYLYKLLPRTDQALIAAELGKLDIVWRTRFGELGRLQTSQLTRKVPTFKLISLEVIQVPPQVRLDQPFEIQCQVKNLSDRIKPKVEIKVLRSKMSSVLYMGTSPISLAPMLPGDVTDFKMKFLPMAVGLHKIAGLSLIEDGSDKGSVEYSPDIYVTA